jgi:hypothetical protein
MPQNRSRIYYAALMLALAIPGITFAGVFHIPGAGIFADMGLK